MLYHRILIFFLGGRGLPTPGSPKPMIPNKPNQNPTGMKLPQPPGNRRPPPGPNPNTNSGNMPKPGEGLAGGRRPLPNLSKSGNAIPANPPERGLNVPLPVKPTQKSAPSSPAQPVTNARRTPPKPSIPPKANDSGNNPSLPKPPVNRPLAKSTNSIPSTPLKPNVPKPAAPKPGPKPGHSSNMPLPTLPSAKPSPFARPKPTPAVSDDGPLSRNVPAIPKRSSQSNDAPPTGGVANLRNALNNNFQKPVMNRDGPPMDKPPVAPEEIITPATIVDTPNYMANASEAPFKAESLYFIFIFLFLELYIYLTIFFSY